MKTVLVTGAGGFIGSNLCAQLEQDSNITILKFDKSQPKTNLKKYIQKADFIFHLAGVNRPKNDSEFDTQNRGLTVEIIGHLESFDKKIPLLLTSSTQAGLDNAYGKSKSSAEKAVFAWSKKNKVQVYVYRLPNVFGKWCRPNYNSVVATFCYNIANAVDITINDPAAKLKLVYIDDVVADFISALDSKKTIADDGYTYIKRSFNTTLKVLAEKIYGFNKSRTSLLIPNLSATFDKFLYATYTSYLNDKDFSYGLDMKKDDRGWLAEFIKSKQFGQIFISRTKPGITRGNHWHHTKVEKFLVIEGKATISFKNYSSGESLSYRVSGDKLQVLDIPAGYSHNIKNIGKGDLLTIFWADETFNPSRADTFYKEV